MVKAISLKLPDELVSASEECAETLRVSRIGRQDTPAATLGFPWTSCTMAPWRTLPP